MMRCQWPVSIIIGAAFRKKSSPLWFADVVILSVVNLRTQNFILIDFLRGDRDMEPFYKATFDRRFPFSRGPKWSKPTTSIPGARCHPSQEALLKGKFVIYRRDGEGASLVHRLHLIYHQGRRKRNNRLFSKEWAIFFHFLTSSLSCRHRGLKNFLFLNGEKPENNNSVRDL